MGAKKFQNILFFSIEQTADVRSKGLPKVWFDRMIDKLAMEDIFKLA